MEYKEFAAQGAVSGTGGGKNQKNALSEKRAYQGRCDLSPLELLIQQACVCRCGD
ncbi:hypothetical protein MRY16398_06560 [Phytobacter sp. MRY16-398]|nr:hypothetical protein MRY16398_06560 [Phytobacter sp. MRY16-398]